MVRVRKLYLSPVLRKVTFTMIGDGYAGAW